MTITIKINQTSEVRSSPRFKNVEKSERKTNSLNPIQKYLEQDVKHIICSFVAHNGCIAHNENHKWNLHLICSHFW